jgi:general secretion pathway protein G
MNHRSRGRRTEGFTLIELLLVVVIIGILAAIVVPRLVGRSDEARISAAKGDLSSISKVLSAYEVDNGKYPTTAQSLTALLVKPSQAPEPKNWKGPYLQNVTEIPKDPWGNDYQYLCPGSKFPNGFDLFSYGADGQSGTDDDIYLGK